MKKVACIGSRKLLKKDVQLCEGIGEWLVRNGYHVSTGNADGADQAYARGANRVDPTKVLIYMPWASYNRDALVQGNQVVWQPNSEWFGVASDFHPFWNELSRGGMALHARNVGIVEGIVGMVAIPSGGYGGGTAMGMRLAASRNIKVYNLREDREEWENRVGLLQSFRT